MARSRRSWSGPWTKLHARNSTSKPPTCTGGWTKKLQVCSRAVVETTGVNADGPRELLGLQVGDRESEPIWRVFLSGLKQRGLNGIRLVVSGTHVGLSKTVGRMFQGGSWCCTKRCAVLRSLCRMRFAQILLRGELNVRF